MSYAVVTGASKGIGYYIAERLAGRGFNLLLISRNMAELQKAAKEIGSKHPVRIQCKDIDLSKRESPKQVFDFIETNKLEVQVLVNNAGYGVWGEFEETPLPDIVDMLELNMVTMVQLSHLLIPHLKKQHPGYILNIASTAAYQAVPSLACYAGSKSFVVLFSRALDFELRKKGVTVTCFSPGPTTTNFNQRAGITSKTVLQRSARFSMEADKTAEMAVDALFRKKKEVVPGWTNRIMSMMTYFVPKSMTEWVAGGLYQE